MTSAKASLQLPARTLRAQFPRRRANGIDRASGSLYTCTCARAWQTDRSASPACKCAAIRPRRRLARVRPQMGCRTAAQAVRALGAFSKCTGTVRSDHLGAARASGYSSRSRDHWARARAGAYGLPAHSWPDATRRAVGPGSLVADRVCASAPAISTGGFTLTSIPLAVLAWIDACALAIGGRRREGDTWRRPEARRIPMRRPASSANACVRLGPDQTCQQYGIGTLGGGFATRI